MATSAVCGNSGSISLGGEILEWSINLLQDSPEATNMQTSAGFKEYIACLRSATGTFTSNIACAVLGAHAAVDFVNPRQTITCDIIVTSCGKKVTVDGVNGFTYNWESTGVIGIN